MTAVFAPPARPRLTAEEAQCPSWCLGVDCRSTDPSVTTRYHAGLDVSVPMGEPDVTASVSVSREDKAYGDRERGAAYVYLCGGGPRDRMQDDWAESLTPAAAVQLGQALIAAGMEAAGLPRLAVTL